MYQIDAPFRDHIIPLYFSNVLRNLQELLVAFYLNLRQSVSICLPVASLINVASRIIRLQRQFVLVEPFTINFPSLGIVLAPLSPV